MVILSTARSNTAENPREIFRNLLPKVEKNRGTYRALLSTLPAPLDTFAKDHFETRLQRVGEDALFGEWIPWIVAELLGVSPSERLEKVSTGWLQLYFSVLLLDDIIDEGQKGDLASNLITGRLLQQRGICQLLCNALNQVKLASVIQAAFDNTAKAATNEIIAHRGKVNRFDSFNLRFVGEKIAFVRICIEAVSQLADSDDLRREHLFSIFEDFAIALQLLDDLCDWQEDADILSMTFPLTVAAERAPSVLKIFKEDKSEEKWEVFLTLIQTGAIQETLQTALTSLESAYSKLGEHDMGTNSRFARYVFSLILAGNRILGIIKTNEPLFIGVKPSEALKDEELRYTMKTIRRELTVVAQSS